MRRCIDFQRLWGDLGYSYEHLFNADETKIILRVQNRTAVKRRSEEKKGGFSDSKVNDTLMVCVNATGGFKEKMWILRKGWPRGVPKEGLEDENVVLRSNSSGE